MNLRNWLIAGGAAALLGACNSNDAQRPAPLPSGTTNSAPEARRAPNLPRASMDGGVHAKAPSVPETTSGDSTGLNANHTAPATGTTPSGNTGANGSGTDNASGSSNPTQH